MTLAEKKQHLELTFRDMESVVVAFSGGVDSALVTALAFRVLGDRALAVTAKSESLPGRELIDSKKIAREIGIRHRIISTQEMKNPEYSSNPINRCFHCKIELYDCLRRVANEGNYRYLVNGVNVDDLGDYRPGISAGQSNGVRSPLCDASMDKADTRALAKELGLSVSEKPASACLSSRVPYGQTITPEKLSMIEHAEDFLLGLGFTQLRVRHHGRIARLEFLPEEIPRYFEDKIAGLVQARLRLLGFENVELDLKGYRSGSLNEAIGR
tara:strand:- start:136 stop:945 length:810 start_codon:yes stop_codon:yes gene_type:complete